MPICVLLDTSLVSAEKGAYSAATLFRRALERFEAENKTDIFELFLKRAIDNDQVLISALNASESYKRITG